MARVAERYARMRRQEILDAASRMFVEHGIDGATMQDIAAGSDLTAGALYRYFDSKEDLVRATLEYCEQRNAEIFQRAAATAQSPLEALSNTGRGVWESFHDPASREHDALQLEVTLAAHRDPDGLGVDARAHILGIVRQLSGMVRAAQTAGELPNDIDPQALAHMLTAVYHGLREMVLQLGDQVDTDAVLETVLRMVEGLREEGALQ
jgi:AcrR family transcriptional regulator